MIYLDDKADTFPAGLFGTPFEVVYKALRAVAADVWAVDPTVYRAGMAWGWYALYKPAALVGFRDVVTAALVSAFAPMIKDTQTDAELVEYLRQWREYVPTFGRLQALYALFGAVVDIQPITDPESQAVIPVEDTRLAFYVRITEIDFSRPLSLADAREIALRATPLGSRPYVYYAFESRVEVPVAAIQQPGEVFVENWEIAQPAAPPVPVGEFILVDSLGNVVYSVENITEIEFAEAGYFTIDNTDNVIFVEQSPFPVVCTYTAQYSETVSLDVILGVRYSSGWASPSFSADDHWYGGVVNSSDITALSEIGIGVAPYSANSSFGPNGNLLYDSECSFELIALYSDAGSTISQYTNLSNLRIEHMMYGNDDIIILSNTDAINSGLIMSYKVRITKIATSQSIAPDAAFDTRLILYADKLYACATDDGQGNVTRYGWECGKEPVETLPTVTTTGYWSNNSYNWLQSTDGPESVTDNSLSSVLRYGYTEGAQTVYVSPDYESGKKYSIVQWQQSGGTTSGRTEFEIVESNGKMCAKNVSGGTLTFYQARVAVCSSNQATVVTVYDGTLVPYNAFKYTAGGTDYYYVLDSVQTDWTDDLSSIGYNTSPYIDMLIGMKWNSDETALEAVTDFNYYWSRVITSDDKNTLNTLELWADLSAYKYGCLKYPLAMYSLTLLAVYYDMGTTEGDVSQFVINYYDSVSGYIAALYAPNHYTGTGIMTWKVRITKL